MATYNEGHERTCLPSFDPAARLSRDCLFLDPVLDARARQRHQEAAKRYAARLIAGDYGYGSSHAG